MIKLIFKDIINWRPSKMYHYIILINFIFSFICFFLPGYILKPLLGYSFYSEDFKIWQPITSMFIHGNLLHLLINMLVFWSFADIIEEYMSKNRFLIFYIISGLAGYILQSLFVDPLIPMVGASGAISGLFGALILIDPNQKLAIIFLPFIKFKAKYFIPFMMSIELILAILNANTGIGHLCHFGGFTVGFLLTGFWITKKIPNYLWKLN